MEHITLDKIHSYMEGCLSSNEAINTEGHIATCDRCYSVFSAFKKLEADFDVTFCSEVGHENDCPEDWKVASLVTGESGAEDKEEMTSHMKGCEYCLGRAAVYYKATLRADPAMATQSEWADRAVGMLTESKVPLKTEAPLLKRLWQSIQRISDPLPPLPGYAIGALAIIILLVWVSLPGKEVRVVTIPSSQKIAFREGGPTGSFAFMGGESEKIDGMKIAMKGAKLFLRWKPINGATEYQISLRKAENGSSVAAMTTVRGPKALVDARGLEKGELYLWLISGKIGDGRTFEYVGKFLFVG